MAYVAVIQGNPQTIEHIKASVLVMEHDAMANNHGYSNPNTIRYFRSPAGLAEDIRANPNDYSVGIGLIVSSNVFSEGTWSELRRVLGKPCNNAVSMMYSGFEIKRYNGGFQVYMEKPKSDGSSPTPHTDLARLLTSEELHYALSLSSQTPEMTLCEAIAAKALVLTEKFESIRSTSSMRANKKPRSP
ncbi:hypothetical protein HY640_00495 [Candidatus Woesearchaeota archaeon]|nr:hypothetical protein [Candidatus Woesearchaeota archaeon]